MAKIKNSGSDSHKTKPKGLNKKAFERVYWPYIPIVLAISVLLSLGVSSGSLQAYVRHPAGRVLSYATSMSISGLLTDTNAERTDNGVSALNLNDKLDAAAQASADDMAARNYWSHYTPDGNPPWIWVTNAGYSYQKVGQNLATGFDDEQSTINGWMASPPHRENLLDPAYSDVGFGFANNPNYTAAGGGPMTIVVAFYGQPQVLSAQAFAPTQSTPTAQPSSQPAAAAPQDQSPPSQTPAVVSKPTVQPATSQTPKTQLAKPVKTSRVQAIIANPRFSPVVTSLFSVAALAIFSFWVRRHLLALHRFLIKGEHYAIRHPLTDIGLVVIAGLLFILSQTAGIIQ